MHLRGVNKTRSHDTPGPHRSAVRESWRRYNTGRCTHYTPPRWPFPFITHHTHSPSASLSYKTSLLPRPGFIISASSRFKRERQKPKVQRFLCSILNEIRFYSSCFVVFCACPPCYAFCCFCSVSWICLFLAYYGRGGSFALRRNDEFVHGIFSIIS